MSHDIILSANDLRVNFHTRDAVVSAVNGVTFDLRAGEVLTVIGESGSGKSVMLRALMGLLPGHAKITGGLQVAGHDIAAATPAQLSQLRGKTISMVFQDPSSALDPVYKVGELIAESVIRHEGISHAAAMQRAEEMLDLVRIPSAKARLGNYPHEMSGGMRQRAMIALALACRPKILLADEPTTALDATVQIQLLILLRSLQAELGMSLVLVTHDMGVAAEIADRVNVMYAGRFVEKGSVEQVLLRPQHPYTRALLNSTVHGGMKGQTLEIIRGVPPDLRRLPQGCAFAARCPAATDYCRATAPQDLHLPEAGHMASCHLLQAEAVAAQ